MEAASSANLTVSVIRCSARESGVNNMAKDVRCEVNSCRFWAEENHCKAESIFVTMHSRKEPSKSEETDCGTFEVK